MSSESVDLDLLINKPVEQIRPQPRISRQNKANYLAFKDFTDGFAKWPIWLMLAYQDIKLRYRRSMLGPFWITLSMAISAYTMGFLYSHLFHSDLQSYFPFLVGGMITWALISTLIVELTDAFSASGNLLKQIKLPYSLYIHRIVTRNIIIFFHNIAVIVPLFFIFHQTLKLNLNTLFLFMGLFIIYINALVYGLTLAMIGSRYRDISQIVKSLIQVIFFITPVMWKPDVLPASKQFIVLFNPFSSYIEMIRAPLIGTLPALHDFVMVSVMTIAGILMCHFLFVRYRARIVYWI